MNRYLYQYHYMRTRTARGTITDSNGQPKDREIAPIIPDGWDVIRHRLVESSISRKEDGVRIDAIWEVSVRE